MTLRNIEDINGKLLVNKIMSWLFTGLWSNTFFAGPARNAPDNGINVKELLKTAPPTCGLVSAEQVQEIKSALKPITPNKPYVSPKPPLIADFDRVFSMGIERYFDELKRRQNNLTAITPEPTVPETIEDPIASAPVVESVVESDNTTEVPAGTSRFSFFDLI